MSWKMFLCMAGCCEKLFVMFLLFTFGFVLFEEKKNVSNQPNQLNQSQKTAPLYVRKPTLSSMHRF